VNITVFGSIPGVIPVIIPEIIPIIQDTMYRTTFIFIGNVSRRRFKKSGSE